MANVKELVGKVCKSVVRNEDEIIFTLIDDRKFKLYHRSDCCEEVWIESVTGDLHDLEYNTMLMAEESFSNDNPIVVEGCSPPDSFTWTFYKFATIKGYVDIRFYGESNGYYSETADFEEMT